MAVERGEVVQLAVKRHSAKARLCPKLADRLVGCEVRPGMILASITAGLQVKDNHHNINVSF